MFLKQIMTGGDRNFAYVVADESTGKTAIIDPSYNPDLVYHTAIQEGFTVEYILNTHRHHDHTNGNDRMFELTGVKAISHGDIEPSTGTLIEHTSTLPLGELTIKIIHTPGHTPESICILVEDALFTGDTLFVGKVGGTDFGEQAQLEYTSLHTKIMVLPGSTRIYPGHDVGVKPFSSVDEEKQSNPFILQPDYDSFLHLKQNWLTYKKEHGIE